MEEVVFITGASGFIGTELTAHLASGAYRCIGLGRSEKKMQGRAIVAYDQFEDLLLRLPETQTFSIVHLAGSSIGDKKWTSENRKEIMESRVEPIRFLFEICAKNNRVPKYVVTASGVGYYGYSGTIYGEQQNPGHGFLAQVCQSWETEAQKFQTLGASVVCVRTPVVFGKSGFLAKMKRLRKQAALAKIGCGKHPLEWIHVSDLVSIYEQALQGTFATSVINAVSPEKISNKEFTRIFKTVVSGISLLPFIPMFLLRWILKEQAELVADGVEVHSDVLANFRFQYADPEQAIRNAMGKEV